MDWPTAGVIVGIGAPTIGIVFKILPNNNKLDRFIELAEDIKEAVFKIKTLHESQNEALKSQHDKLNDIKNTVTVTQLEMKTTERIENEMINKQEKILEKLDKLKVAHG